MGMKMPDLSLSTRRSVSRLMRFMGLSQGMETFQPKMMQFSGTLLADWLMLNVVNTDVTPDDCDGDCSGHAAIVHVAINDYNLSKIIN